MVKELNGLLHLAAFSSQLKCLRLSHTPKRYDTFISRLPPIIDPKAEGQLSGLLNIASPRLSYESSKLQLSFSISTICKLHFRIIFPHKQQAIVKARAHDRSFTADVSKRHWNKIRGVIHTLVNSSMGEYIDRPILGF